MSFSIDENGLLKVDTNRSGPFVFQIGLDKSALVGYKTLVDHAYACFASMPLLPEIVSELENIALVTSIYGTNTIEGGNLSETETAHTLITETTDYTDVSKRRVKNLQDAYRIADLMYETALSLVNKEQMESAKVQGSISLEIYDYMLNDIHKTITESIPHDDNIPGQYRDNPKFRSTKVGDTNHGGIYSPPKCIEDIKILVQAFTAWANSKPVMALPPLYRAPLLHYYLELIHPFWDGNGRTGRVIEAIVLKAARYDMAPYAISKFYLENIDSYYVLFNLCRKQAQKKHPYPNTEFVKFHLIGMLQTIYRLHDRANKILSKLLLEASINILSTKKVINERQQLIISQLKENPQLGIKNNLTSQSWYQALYKKLTPRTMIRDISRLEELHLIKRESNGNISLVYATQQIELSTYEITKIDYKLPE